MSGKYGLEFLIRVFRRPPTKWVKSAASWLLQAMPPQNGIIVYVLFPDISMTSNVVAAVVVGEQEEEKSKRKREKADFPAISQPAQLATALAILEEVSLTAK